MRTKLGCSAGTCVALLAALCVRMHSQAQHSPGAAADPDVQEHVVEEALEKVGLMLLCNAAGRVYCSVVGLMLLCNAAGRVYCSVQCSAGTFPRPVQSVEQFQNTR